MSGGRRSTAIDSGLITTLTGMTDADITKLRDDFSIQAIDDLALLDKADVDAILGSDASTFFTLFINAHQFQIDRIWLLQNERRTI